MEDIVLKCPDNPFWAKLSWAFTFQFILVFPLFLFLKPYGLGAYPLFLFFVFYYSVGTTFLLSQLAFRQYTKLILKPNGEAHYYRYGGKSSNIDIICMREAIEVAGIRKNRFGLCIELSFLASGCLWSIQKIGRKERLKRKIIIEEARYEVLEAWLNKNQ